jgi:hypothetical protein
METHLANSEAYVTLRMRGWLKVLKSLFFRLGRGRDRWLAFSGVRIIIQVPLSMNHASGWVSGEHGWRLGKKIRN